MVRRLLALLALFSLGVADTPFWPHYPTRNVTLLDGTWSYGFEANLPDALALEASDAKFTTTMAVPSAFDVAPPGVLGPRGTAFYKRDISVTPNTKAALLVAACSFYCRVFVDGAFLADHRAGGYSPFWVSIPPSSVTSRELIIIVDNRFNKTTAPTTTGGDFYFYSGLTRNVLLHELPDLSLSHVEVVPVDVERGLVNIRAILHEHITQSIALTLTFEQQPPTTLNASVVDGIITLTNIPVPTAQPWSFDTPHLTQLTVAIPGDAIAVRFGLRVVGVDRATGRLTINGKIVKLKGVNRHTMYPDTGSAVTVEQMQQDLAILKDLGVNFVRGAHYPQDQRFLDLLDEAGIGMWEETLGPGVGLSDLQSEYFLTYQKQQIDEMVTASYNHPSVLMHAFYNEGPSNDKRACDGYNFSATAIRARMGTPPVRLVTYASDHSTSDVCLHVVDVVSFNSYPAWYDHAGDLSQPAKFWNSMAEWVHANYPTKPFFISETGAGGVYEWTNHSDPRWSQRYQAEVIQRDAATAMGNSNISGITIWQFSDIKANDDNTKQCGQCVYAPHPPSLSQPWNCTYIDVSCGRPGGENHKGVVDFWRRKKESFDVLKTIYAGGEQ